MEVIGKKINFIKLHNFLDRIGVEQVYSALHTFYAALTAGVGPDEEIEWAGRKYTKLTLLSTMRQEEGVLEAFNIKRHPSGSCEVNLHFTSGNEIVVKIKNQEQFLQITKYLLEADNDDEKRQRAAD